MRVAALRKATKGSKSDEVLLDALLANHGDVEAALVSLRAQGSYGNSSHSVNIQYIVICVYKYLWTTRLPATLLWRVSGNVEAALGSKSKAPFTFDV